MKLVAFILNLKLRVKLLLAFGSILVLSGLLMLKSLNTISKLNQYQNASDIVDSLNVHSLEAEKSIQHFIYEGYKSGDFQKNGSNQTISLISNHLKASSAEVDKMLLMNAASNDSLQTLTLALAKVDGHFKKLTSLMRKRGFKDYGLEGRLRESIHAVEQSSFSYSKADMLTLRRHEKDFFLRRDMKYVDEFNKKADAFRAVIAQSKPSRERDEVLDLLRKYQSTFAQVVDIDAEIGLQENHGLKKLLNVDLEKLHGHTAHLRAAIKEQNLEFKSTAWIQLLALFLIQVVGGGLMAVFYSDQITRAVKELQKAMQSFARGTLPRKLTVRSTEEIGLTKDAFNHLLDRINAAQEFSLVLGKGNLEVQYPKEFNQDMLAQSLIKMQQQLKEALEKQRIINWANQGMAQLNEVLKAENEEIAALGDRILKVLVQYLNANQGALYLTKQNSSQKWAERISTYAYGKKKFVDQRVDFGNGLVGQCLLEKSTIQITQVPSGYVKITSGLGEATPRFIVIVPLLIRDEILGVIEIASFEEMGKYQIDFLERIASNIASILFNKKSSEETAALLRDSQEQGRRMAQQEEVVRQNAEEMQAITEQLEREKQHLQQEITRLQSLLNQTHLQSA